MNQNLEIMNLQKGYMYTNNTIWKNTAYVYIDEYMNGHDNIYVFVFWDTNVGKEIYVNCPEASVIEIRQSFVCIGAEMPYRHYADTIDTHHTYPLQNSSTFICKHSLYFQNVLAGADIVQNWFEWYETNKVELANELKKTTFYKLKIYPLRTIAQLLDSEQQIFTISPRYAWLDQSILKIKIHGGNRYDTMKL